MITYPYRIAKEIEISAAHQLNGLPPEHQCSRMHGHNYVIVVNIESDSVDDTGFVLDYGELDFIKHELDHRTLNSVLSGNTTAENLARYITGRVRGIMRKHYGGAANCRIMTCVNETPKTSAWYSEEVAPDD